MEALTAADLVAEARQQIDDLGSDHFAARMTDDPLVVDLREPAEVAGGVIPGAICVPRGMLEFRADTGSPYHLQEFDPNRPVLLYCASGGRSALAGAALRRMGYAEVGHLDGGIAAWTESGREIG